MGKRRISEKSKKPSSPKETTNQESNNSLALAKEGYT